MNAKIAGRPDLMGDRTSLTLGAGMKGILSQGGRVGRFTLYFKGGRPTYEYNFLGLQRFTVAA